MRETSVCLKAIDSEEQRWEGYDTSTRNESNLEKEESKVQCTPILSYVQDGNI